MGNKDAIAKNRKEKEALANKEKRKGGVFGSTKERAAAGKLFGVYSGRMDKRFAEFKKDLAKSFGVNEAEIIPVFEKMGLSDQANVLKELAKQIQTFKTMGNKALK